MNEISESRRWLMWFCAACFYAYQFILRVSPGAIASDLMSSLIIDACTLGTVVSYYYNGYALMQVPTGIIIDRLGLRWPLSIACLLCASGCLMFTYSTSTIVLSVARTIMGIGSAFGFLSCVKVASQNFPPQRLTLFISLTMVIGTIGATIGGTPFAEIAKMIGWRESYKILALFGLLLSISIIVFFHNSHTTDQLDTASTARSENILTGFLSVISNPQTWIYGIYGFMMYVPLSGFVDLWAVPFMETAYHLDGTVASGVITTSYLGLAVGAPLWSSFVSKAKSYRRVLFWSALLTGISFTVVIYLPQIQMVKPYAVNLTFIFMALGGAASAGQFIAFAGITQINLTHRTAMATGTHNMLCMISGAVMMPFIGNYLNKLGTRLPLTDQLIYSYDNYQAALIMVPLCVLLAIISTYFIKEHYSVHACDREPDNTIKSNVGHHAEN